MQTYLPSKIFIAVAASALFIIGGGYFIFYGASSKYHVLREEKSEQKPIAQSGEASLFAAKDTDGDGLKDWEEVLWHTDPRNADTDGDGTKDNDEILAKRDPAKVGPNDAIDALAQKTGDSGSPIMQEKQEERPDTLTARLARDFGEVYLRRKFGGAGDTDETYFSDVLFSGMTSALAEASKQTATAYFSRDDITINPDSSSAATRRYINQIGALLALHAAASQENELDIVLEAMFEEDFSGLSVLLSYRDAYQSAANDMRRISVPVVLADAHRDMMNSFWRLGLIAERLSMFENDPVGGAGAINAYLAEARRSIKPLERIVREIENDNLVFGKNEGGAVFSKYLSLL